VGSSSSHTTTVASCSTSGSMSLMRGARENLSPAGHQEK
jgi:hypothetical protein